MGFITEDNFYNRTMTKVFDLCLLSLLTTLCCVPVVTAGTALTSMYAVMMKMVKNQEGPIIAAYLKEIKQNLKGSFGGTAILILGAVLIGFDLSMWTQNNIEGRSVFYGLTLAVGILFVAVMNWYLAVRARFEETTVQALQNAFRFAVAFLPVTLAIGVYTLLLVWVMLKYSVLLLFFPLVGYALICYPQAVLIGGRLDQYIKERGLVSENKEDDTVKDGDEKDFEKDNKGRIVLTSDESGEEWEFPDVVEAAGRVDNQMNQEENGGYGMTLSDKLSYFFYNHTAELVLIGILLAAVLGLSYHFLVHGGKCEFFLAVVNGYSNQGDIKLSDALNEYYSYDGEKEYAYVDTTYQIAYSDGERAVENLAADDSFYEKFFLNIRIGSMDAAIIPESFFRYCNDVEDMFYDVEDVLSKKQVEMYKELFVTGVGEEGSHVNGLRVDGCSYLQESGISFVDVNGEDSYILVFPIGASHFGECQSFVEYMGLDTGR